MFQIIDGGEAYLSLRMMSNFEEELDVSYEYERPYHWHTYSAHQLLRFFDGEMFFSQRQIILIMRSLYASRMFERQVHALFYRALDLVCMLMCLCDFNLYSSRFARAASLPSAKHVSRCRIEFSMRLCACIYRDTYQCEHGHRSGSQ
jgi:hypothetical protein